MVIGITGPTGAGKTTALNQLRKLGGCVLDADAIYHQLLECDAALQKELADRFGPMTDPQGRFDRKKLGAVVFHDPRALADLNAIAHRHVVAEIRRQLAAAERAGCPAAAIDAIALFESGADSLCQATLAIIAAPETRVRRIMAREGITEDYARARVAAQRPDEFYTRRCGYTLANDCGGPEEFAGKALALFQEILKRGN